MVKIGKRYNKSSGFLHQSPTGIFHESRLTLPRRSNDPAARHWLLPGNFHQLATRGNSDKAAMRALKFGSFGLPWVTLQ